MEKADFSFSTNFPGHRKQLHDCLGPTCGGLHHPQGPGPLPHQAGKRLPAAGIKPQG